MKFKISVLQDLAQDQIKDKEDCFWHTGSSPRSSLLQIKQNKDTSYKTTFLKRKFMTDLCGKLQ